MSITLSLQSSMTTRDQPTRRSLEVATMFGLSLDEDRQQVIIPPIQLTLAPSQIIFITGVSGGGKSTLLRLITQSLKAEAHQQPARPSLVCIDQLPALHQVPLIDALARPMGDGDQHQAPVDLETVCRWLSLAGLNDAAVMLRRPRELSEGQRHRLRLAQAFAVAERQRADWSVLLIDEFASLLDRTTARALAQSVRRWVSQARVCLIAATAHDDLLESLDPDTLVEVAPAGACSVHRRPA